MRFLVISDTHGKTEAAMTAAGRHEKPDYLIHLGDYLHDGEKMAGLLGVPLLAVRGNMDGCFSDGESRILETPAGKILLTHGHMESAKSGFLKLMYKAEEVGCRAVFFGHTHIPLCTEENGLFLLNPGSMTYPVGNRPGSYALAEADENGIRGKIYYADEELQTLMRERQSKPKGSAETGKADPGRNWDAEGGSLRDLLNNSDRF